MSYGVNTWALQPGRARSAGSSSARSTRTAKRKRSTSARRAPKKSAKRKSTSASKRRSLQDPRDYHALPIGKAPQGWGGSQAEWVLYSQGKAPGKWL